jgi:hypothetical protein
MELHEMDLTSAKDRKTYMDQRQKERIERATRAAMICAVASTAAVIGYFLFFTTVFMFACGWGFGDALYFVVVSTTTVGYGAFNFEDKPFVVRLLFYSQSLTGFLVISLILIENQITVKRAELALDGFLIRGEGEENHPDLDLILVRRRIFFRLLKVGALFATSTAFYASEEGWSLNDAFYFSWTSISTIGFGDFRPTKMSSKIFTSFFLLSGCGLFASLVNAFAQYHLHSFNNHQIKKLLGLVHNGARLTLFDTF